MKNGRRVIRRCALVGAVLLGACTSLRPIPGTPREALRAISPSDDIVVEAGERTHRMTEARVVGDSLLGIESVHTGERVAVALAEIEAVRINRPTFIPPLVVAGLLSLLLWSYGENGTR